MENNNGKYKLDTENRLTTLETLFKEFMKNHFPSLEKKVESLNNKLIAILIFALITSIGIIVNLLLRFME